MGLELSDACVDEFESCVRQPLIAFLRCPSGPRCFSYPQFLVQNNKFVCLEDAAFPDDGCLPMTVRGTTAEEMQENLGDIVIMTVGFEPRSNEKFGNGERSRYNSIYDPTYKGAAPAVQFTALRRHRLSSMMMQVLEIQEDRINFSNVKSATVHIFDDQSAPQTQFVLVAQVANGKKKYYGPFEYKIEENGEIELSGSGRYDFYIAGFNEESFDFLIDIADDEGNIAAQFVDAEEFLCKFSDADNKFDWIPDQVLVDLIGRVARLSKSLELSKKKIQTFKQEILAYNNASEQITLTSQRREKMTSLISNYENWQDLSDSAKKEKIENVDAAQLAAFVLDDENFEEFYDKVIEHKGLRERVEQAEAEYRSREQEAENRLEKVQKELRAYELEAEKKKGELLAEIEEETKEKQEESHRLQGEIDELSISIKRLKQEKDELEEDRILIQRQIRKAVDEMSDDISVSKKILENEMLKQIVSSISAKENGGSDANDPRKTLVFSTRSDEGSLGDKQLVNLLCEDIKSAGRDFEYNQIVNIMICLIQGYITTFAGLPGTGKTSLASILSGVLGLQSEIGSRYMEISVEKGWTSYKDLIGYYNPFTNNLERSVAFDAFELLDRECKNRSSVLKPPYVFLLDEANLSSLEHYWSPFLKACDSFQKGSFSISLGGKFSLEVPEYVRFIATVNFDHTTEELSPRFLDRSWVITLDPDDEVYDDDAEVANTDFSLLEPYSYEKLTEVFGYKAGFRMGNDLRAKLKEVIETCELFHFPVSPRSQKMMRGYICTAERLMDKDSVQSAYSPVDYAVAQKILPQLSGTEDRVRGLLEKLGTINGLPETKKRVERMLETGSENGYYQYFG